MSKATTRREAASPYGDWAGAIDTLMSYRYLASRPRPLDDHHAEGLMTLRPDLRTAADTVLAAPLAIAMLDVAGITIDRRWITALTQIDLAVLDGASDVGEVFLTGRVIREARTQIFTEATIFDAEDRDRVIGFGTANWSVIVPTPADFEYPAPGMGVEGMAEIPPLWQAYSGRRRADGLIEIPGLSPAIGTHLLHHGPMLVITETAAREAAADAVGTDSVAVEQLALTIVAPGRQGPFVSTPILVAARGETVGCRVELRDQGQDDRLVATAFVRLHATT
jgi:acyl-coenzyme A thioesterase PaaI-like protein